MINKMEDRTCPKCGQLYAAFEFAKVALGPGAQVNLSCEQGHKWSEFYNLSYQGFWWNGTRYDSYGDAIPKPDKDGQTPQQAEAAT